MARGGFRPGAGRPKSARVRTKTEVAVEARSEDKTPLDYMLSVMNDPAADKSRRDRMAIAAAPFVHGKADVEQEGKKAQRQAAAEQAVSAGKFAVRPAPKLVVSNR